MGRHKITNEEEALAAVKKDGMALEDVPERLRKEVHQAMKGQNT